MAADQLTFVKIEVRDLGAQSAFYEAVFGLVTKHRISGGTGGDAYEEAVLRGPQDSGPALVLICHPHRDERRPDTAVLGFEVADLERTVEAAAVAGGVIRSGPRSLPQSGVSLALLTDPEGHTLELLRYG